MKTPFKTVAPLAAIACVALAHSATAAPLTGWLTSDDVANEVLTGAGTNSPSIAYTTAPGSFSGIFANFTTLSLGAIGDSITLTFDLTLNANVGTQGNGFRFGLFDNNSGTQVTTNTTAAGFPQEYSGFTGAMNTSGAQQ